MYTLFVERHYKKLMGCFPSAFLWGAINIQLAESLYFMCAHFHFPLENRVAQNLQVIILDLL